MNNLQNIHNEALRLHQQGKIPEALSLYNKILQQDKNDPMLYHLVGTAHLQMGQARQAVEYLRLSIEINPNNAFTHNMLGAALIRLDRDAEALSSFCSAIAEKQDYVDAYINKGIALGKLNIQNEALASLDQAASINPRHVQRVLYDKLIGVSQESIPIRALFLSIIARQARDPSAPTIIIGGSGKANNGNLIFGLGTGRSGSTSLTCLFKEQDATYYAHEHAPIVPWGKGHSEVEFHINRMTILSETYQKVVDVSHWWLPYVETILSVVNKAKFVCIQRDRNETVKSFLKIKGGGCRGSINHWIDHDGKYFQKNAWDRVYPKYDANSLEGALISYWDDYYEQANNLQNKYPDNFRIFNITNLKHSDGQFEILDFCQYEHPVAVDLLHKNAGGVTDGINLRMPYVYRYSYGALEKSTILI